MLSSSSDFSLLFAVLESLLSHGDQESETPIGLQSGREDLTRLSVSSSENGDELDESGGGHDGNRQSQNIMGSGYGLDSSWSTENRSLIMGGNLTVKFHYSETSGSRLCRKNNARIAVNSGEKINFFTAKRPHLLAMKALKSCKICGF